ncbi:MAG: carbonic anhydrase, partial [Acidobacteriota bacterium]
MLKRPCPVILFFVFICSFITFVPGQEPSQQSKSHRPDEQVVDIETALKRLVDGNRRFQRNQPVHPHATVQRRVTLGLTGQHPFAIILSCADSRVPPESIFDAGLGDLFVVRVAGHIVDDAVIGSIEYASEHLGARLVVVLGHEKCGAVQAAIDNNREAHLRYLVEAIQPAVVKVRTRTPPTDPRGFVDRVVWANVFEAMSVLETSEPVLRKMVS